MFNQPGILNRMAGASVGKGRAPMDQSFYTYGAPPRPNLPPRGLPGPGLMPVRGANFASGGTLGPIGMLQRAAGSRFGTAGMPAATPSGASQGILRAIGGVKGPGTGRSDEIDARLSDGEYVMDAETVALLGDGSTDAGVKRLDELRQKLRAHKGKALARGKISPDARKPEAYLKKGK